MIGLDTNVHVRYLAQDDPGEARAATGLLEQTLSEDEPGYLDHVVLGELGWVLERCYGVGREGLADIVEGLLTARQLVSRRRTRCRRRSGPCAPTAPIWPMR